MHSPRLGVAVSVGAAFSRLPQIAKILMARSTTGLHEGMYRADLVCNAITALYHRSSHFPMDTYGECLAFCAQDVCILALFAAFGGPGAGVSAREWLVFGSLTAVPLLYPGPARAPLAVMQSCAALVLQAARLPQIILNKVRQSTGELSVTPFLLNLIGSLVRLHTTTSQLKGNRVLMAGFLASVVTNAILVYQCWIYRKNNATLSTR